MLIGEVGLDRGTALGPQQTAFDEILDACTDQPVLLSIHSTSRTREVLAALTHRPHPGAILHWFNGTTDEVRQAVELGCYFSVNAAMTDERISWIPHERLLPETDFPSSRRSTRASRPGDIDHLEQRLAALTSRSMNEIRSLWYLTLPTFCTPPTSKADCPAESDRRSTTAKPPPAPRYCPHRTESAPRSRADQRGQQSHGDELRLCQASR